MTTSYTTLLGLALPQTGDLSGTWGDTVNNSITQLVEDSVAGYATADVTSGNWTLTTTGSGVSNQARMMVLIPTGTPGTSRNIIAPAHSKIYVVVNQSNASVVIKGAATTGVTIASGKTTVVAWDGSDFVEITPTNATNATNATNIAGGVQGSIPYQSAANVTALLAPGTAGQVLVSGGPSANPSYSSTAVFTSLSTSADITVHGVTVGLGANGTSVDTAIGVAALGANTTGHDNTAIGSYALSSNTTGSSNTANGRNTLFSNTTGSQNASYGYAALFSNTTGNGNTAYGTQALNQNTTGSYNVAFGLQSLISSTTSSANTAVGAFTLYSNTTGSNNTASGYSALNKNTTGVQNTASGVQALYNNTTGNSNIASGYQALANNTTGSYNTAVGGSALASNTTGSGNTAIGPLNSSGTYAPVFDPTTENNRVAIGSTAVTNAYIQVAWTVVSDARDKTNFNAVPHGLDFVNQLKPTAYQFRTARDSEETNGRVRYGFKAQDILALEGAAPVIIDNEDPDKLKYTSDSLIPVLVNAIQELTARLQILENK